MLNFLSKGVKKIFGTKYERDINTYLPVVDQVNEAFEKLQGLSNDELREKTHEFRQRITEYLTQIDHDIEQVKAEGIEEEDLVKKEELFKELDELRLERDKQLEQVLKDILPEAFAVVKETARRFTHNETL